jgi:hypothetical protein
MDNMWWDLRTLIKVFTGQLNRSDMGQSYPMYPENPFTRVKIIPNELFSLKERIDAINNINNSITLNVAMNVFFTLTKRQMTYIFKQKQYGSVLYLIDILGNDLRYKLINYKDSQGNYCGYWVDKKKPLSKFEECYNKYIKMFYIVNGMFIPIDTPRFRKLENELSSMPVEEYMY